MLSKTYKLSYVVVVILNLIWILNRYVFSIREALLTIIISVIVLAAGCFLRRMGKTVDLHTAVRQTVWAIFVYYCFVLYAVLISRGLVFRRDYGSTLNLIPFRCVPVICFFSFFVEVIQYLTHSGSADVDDIILNTAGGLIGFVLYKIGSLIIQSDEGMDLCLKYI